jgi:hypothetical protein
MERTKEYPWGRCASCGYAGHGLTGDHPYDDYDFLCSVCLSHFDRECPWVVEKVERETGEVWSSWRHRTEGAAAKTLARLNGNPEAAEGKRFAFRLHKENHEAPQERLKATISRPALCHLQGSGGH